MTLFRRAGSALGLLAVAGVLLQSTEGNAQHATHAGHDQHVAVATGPTLPGQDAFGAIQEVVRVLEADPTTDWTKVRISPLRDHLIDMHEVTLNAVTTERALPTGVEVTVTGRGRTRGSIQRMVPAHARELAALGWSASAGKITNGVKLVVTSNDPIQATRIKALGFAGIMVQGGHHQPHHLLMVKGQFSH